MTPTVWTEDTAVDTGWVEGIPENDGSDDYFVDFLFEGTGLFALVADYTEDTAPAVSYVEDTVGAASWTEDVA